MAAAETTLSADGPAGFPGDRGAVACAGGNGEPLAGEGARFCVVLFRGTSTGCGLRRMWSIACESRSGFLRNSCWRGCFRGWRFLGQPLRHNLRGGWAARGANSVAWFCVIWAGFIFLFFSASHSKLIPYILPVFPPLALLIGCYVALGWEVPREALLRPGLSPLQYSRRCGGAGAVFGVGAPAGGQARAGAAGGVGAACHHKSVSVLCTRRIPCAMAGSAARRAHGTAGAGDCDRDFFHCGGVCAVMLRTCSTGRLTPLAFSACVWSCSRATACFSYHEYFQDFRFISGAPSAWVGYRGENGVRHGGGRPQRPLCYRGGIPPVMWAGHGRVSRHCAPER